MADEPNQNAENAKTYRIASVMDFLSVPEDRREVCLREFRVWLGVADAMGLMLAGIAAEFPQEFVWVDDGKHEFEVNINANGSRFTIAKGPMPGFEDE